MLKNSYCCYNKNLDVFEIRNEKSGNVVSKKECNYGIEFHFDINMNLVAIIIPEPDILFGIDVKVLQDFACNNFT